MRTPIMLAAPAMLAACAMTEPPKPVPPDDPCGMSLLGSYRNAFPDLPAIRAAVDHDRIRVIRPGDAVTLDYRPDRLNIELGADGRIKSFRCG